MRKLHLIITIFLVVGLSLSLTACNNDMPSSDKSKEKEGDGANQLVEKPVLYLYPPTATDVNIVLGSDDKITASYPKYANGWDVTAYPDGRLIDKADNSEHFYLFWEAALDIDYDLSEGFVVRGEDTEKFLKEKLSYMGLLPREYNDFIVYWLPRMQANKYNLVSFQGKSYTDVSTLGISPKPDSMLRIMMAFKSLESPVNIPEQKLDIFERKGFTAVEWGGAELK